MAKRLEPFDAVAFGPGPRDIVMRRRPPSDLRRLWRWVRAHEWPAQVVLVLMIVTVCYVALVFWLLVGAGVAPWVCMITPSTNKAQQAGDTAAERPTIHLAPNKESGT
jgi:hypothetical protein